MPLAYADHATTSVSAPPGSAVPGCEETDECYIPSKVFIDVGGEVTWTNDDTAAHTVTSGTPDGGPNGFFDSSLFMAGSTFSVKFDGFDEGTYPYFCMVHPWMVGIVVVGDANGPIKEPEKPMPPQSEDINQLKKEIQELKDENLKLKMDNKQLKNKINSQQGIIDDLRKKIDSLNEILIEQVKVIYDWVVSR